MDHLSKNIHVALLTLLVVAVIVMYYKREHAIGDVINDWWPNIGKALSGEHAQDLNAFHGAADPELANPRPLSWIGEEYGVPAKVPRTKPLNPNGVYCGQYNANYPYPHTWIG